MIKMNRFFFAVLLLTVSPVFSFVKQSQHDCFKSINKDFVIEKITINPSGSDYRIVIFPFTREKARRFKVNNLNDTLYSNVEVYIPSEGLKLKGLSVPLTCTAIFNAQKDTLYSMLTDKKGMQRIDTLTICQHGN